MSDFDEVESAASGTEVPADDYLEELDAEAAAEDVADDSNEAQEARNLGDFFTAKAPGFKNVEAFESALHKYRLTPDRLMGVIDQMLKRCAPSIKCRALEALRRYAELVYGSEIRLRTDALEQETAEELAAKKQAIQERMLTLLAARNEKTA